MKSMVYPQFPGRRRDGVALVIVLAFVVIITGVILAFFARALANRQISNASANQTKADLLAQGAADSIIGDLQQEIVLSSSAGTITTGAVTNTLYTPLAPAGMLPQISGTTGSQPGVPPNLLKRSAYNYSANQPLPFYTGYAGTVKSSGTIAGNTINVSSTTPSLNGRTVSTTRWNSSYLLPLSGTSTNADATPLTTGTAAFIPPDWVLVPRNGAPPTTWSTKLTNPSVTNNNYVIGRYAYAIYHEGGLLDANVAGYPVETSTTQFAYKPGLAYADLTQVGLTPAQVDQLVAWRNYVSAQTPGSSYQSPGFTAASGSSYYNSVVSNPSGFLTVSSTAVATTGTITQTDRMFGSRQELIKFAQNGLGLSGPSMGALQFLGTFSRGLNQPSFAPDPTRPLITMPYQSGGNNAQGQETQVNNPINPAFLSVRVSGTFQRYNGSIAAVGEPLVKKRFALSKLAWITYLGPSALRTIPTTNPGVTNRDYDMWQLVNTYGISPAYLAQGTAANILNYFGLVWAQDKTPASTLTPSSFHDNEMKWFYRGHNTPSGKQPGTLALSNTAGAISRLVDIAALGSSAREPDFFELLKAAVAAGSKAKGAFNLNSSSLSGFGTYYPYWVQTFRDISLDYSIIQLGANIIDQFKVDGYSTRIVFDDGSGSIVNPVEIRGVENLPYMYRFHSAVLKLRLENPDWSTAKGVSDEEDTSASVSLVDSGVGMIMHVPTIWNPHDENAPPGYPGPTGGALSVTTPSPNFRLIADSVVPPNIYPSTGATVGFGYNTFAGFGSSANPNTPSTSGTPSPKVYTTGQNGTGTPIVPGVGPIASANFYSLNPLNTNLTFSVPSAAYFREPTVLSRPNIPAIGGTNCNLQMIAPKTSIPQYASILNSAGTKVWTGLAGGTGAFLSDAPNPLDLTSNVPGSGQGYVGICFGLYPINWLGKASSSGTAGIYRARNVGAALGAGAGEYIDYRLQYKDPNATDASGSWVTYDEKYCFLDTIFLQTPFGTSQTGNLSDQADGAQGGDWGSYADPRTSRFGCVNGKDLEPPVQTPGGVGVAGEWTDTANGVSVTDRPDTNSGYAISDDRSPQNVVTSAIQEFYYIMAGGWNINAGYFRMGMLSQNTPSQTADNGIRFNGDSSSVSPPGDTGPMNYADPDGVIRGAMGNYVPGSPASTTVGLPLATAYGINGAPVGNQAQSRPYFLHHPFRSVGDLGYVFSGMPWKNVDFFTPQSGDAALLDVFTAYETPDLTTNSNPLVAGVVNLNTQQEPVLQALLAGASVDEAQTTGSANTGFIPLTGTQANTILASTSGTSYLAFTSGNTTELGPLRNVSELVGRWNPPTASISGTGDYNGPSAGLTGALGTINATMSNVDRFHEAYLRPLAAVGNTRVWNLLIDLVAQTGRYPLGASSAANFVVDGEQRYWVHIAIDRYTGQILDKQVEVVRD